MPPKSAHYAFAATKIEESIELLMEAANRFCYLDPTPDAEISSVEADTAGELGEIVAQLTIIRIYAQKMVEKLECVQHEG